MRHSLLVQSQLTSQELTEQEKDAIRKSQELNYADSKQ